MEISQIFFTAFLKSTYKKSPFTSHDFFANFALVHPIIESVCLSGHEQRATGHEPRMGVEGLDKSCKKCIYLIKAIGKLKPVLVCTNRDGARGQLYCSDLCSPCRNYRTIPVIDRPAVVQPKNSPIRLIPLTKGKVAIVDAEDYEFLNSFKWSANLKAKKVYAYRNVNRKNIYMHRVITNAPAGKVVDHIDRNGLNNRKSNLRICSVADNSRNSRGWGKTSQYKGVSWSKGKKKWLSVIRYDYKYRHIGCFEKETDAAKAYDQMARKLFGQFAYLNFPKQ